MPLNDPYAAFQPDYQEPLLPGLFPLFPLELDFVAEETLRMPEYKGGLFRSGLGLFLRQMVCVTGAPACDGCPCLSQCPYPHLFDNPIRPGEARLMRRYTHAPHPFVLRPPLDPDRHLPAGRLLRARLTLLASAMPYLPELLEALQRMGQSGSYGGRYRLERVRSALTGKELARSDTDGWLRPPPAWLPPAQNGHAFAVRIEFLTPLRIRTRGRYNPRPGFMAITHALLRRLHLLAAVHGGGAVSSAWMRPLLEAADRIRTRRAQWNLYRWSRTSGRQQAEIPMDGLRGELEAEGELAPLLPYLLAGQWLHVGSGTSSGMGAYCLTVLE